MDEVEQTVPIGNCDMLMYSDTGSSVRLYFSFELNTDVSMLTCQQSMVYITDGKEVPPKVPFS